MMLTSWQEATYVLLLAHFTVQSLPIIYCKYRVCVWTCLFLGALQGTIEHISRIKLCKRVSCHQDISTLIAITLIHYNGETHRVNRGATKDHTHTHLHVTHVQTRFA